MQFRNAHAFLDSVALLCRLPRAVAPARWEQIDDRGQAADENIVHEQHEKWRKRSEVKMLNDRWT